MRTLSQLKNDKYVMADKDWFIEKNYIKEYKHDALLIYTYMIRGISSRGELYFSVNNIMDYLGVSHKNTNRRKKIIEILGSFDKDEIFKFDIKKLNDGDLVVAKEIKELESFTILYDFEIDSIINYDSHTDKGKLLSVFLYIKGCVNSSSCIAYPQIETIKIHTNINSDSTIVKYINILQDIGLILFANVGLRVFADNSVKYAENAYVMNYEGYDKILNDYLLQKQIELSGKNVAIKNKKETNIKRSETMKKIWAERKANNN